MLKNLKVFERLKRKEKKPGKKNKFKLYLITGVLTLSTLFTACSIVPEKTNTDINPSYNTSYVEVVETPQKSDIELEIESMMEHYATAELDEYNSSIVNSSVTLSQASAGYLVNEISNMPIDYAYSDLYDVETSYQRYQSLSSYQGTIHPILSSGKLDADELYNLVLQNNERYKKEKPYSIYTYLDNSYIKEYCVMIADTVNEMLERDWDYNLEDLSYNLQHLCMFKSATGANAQITVDGCLVVMPSNLDMMKSISNNESADKITISHETVHLFQRMSSEHRDAIGAKTVYGVTYEFEDLRVNSLFNRWYQEATAETFASHLHDSDSITYSNYIGYLNTLRLVHGLDENFDVACLERLSMQHDLGEFFKEFGCTTYEEQMELLKVMYAINIIQMEPEDFMTLYEEKVLGHEMSEDELVQLKIELKVGLCQYFTQEFYTNLINRMANKSVKLEDVFELISTLESSFSTHILYTDESRYETILPFLNDYNEIQSKFFQLIADELGLQLSDVQAAYNAFNGKMEVKTNSILNETVYEQIEIPWVDDVYRSTIQKKHDETSRNKTVSINEFVNMQQNAKKY